MTIQSMGGIARSKSLTASERSSIAAAAAVARWKTKPRPLCLGLVLEAGYVEIPLPMSEEDYNLLTETLKLWKDRLIKKPI